MYMLHSNAILCPTHRRRLGWAAVPIVALVLLAGCGSDETATTTTASSDATTNTASGGESAQTVVFDKKVQQELKDVGCYEGGVDGIIGPKTDAAIVAFQTAAGLEVDGELGPETDNALSTASSEGKTVCDSSSPTSPTAPPTKPSGPSGGTAPCTSTAILAALEDTRFLIGYQCAGGYAAGDASGDEPPGGYDYAFVLKSEGGQWVSVKDSPECSKAPDPLNGYCNVS